MDIRANQFLVAVLGVSGAEALLKASDRVEGLEHALLPRTILAWINTAPMFDGEIPGIEDTHVAFSKSEEGFSGEITIGDGLYKFENQTLFHIAATVAVAVGVDENRTSPDVRNIDMERLGKSIDMLAKARRASEELSAAAHERKYDEDKKCGKPVGKYTCALAAGHKGSTHQSAPFASPDDSIKAKPIFKDEDLEKKAQSSAASGSGPAAAPIAPAAAAIPTPTAPQPSKESMAPAPPKIPTVKPPKAAKPINTMKLTRSETAVRCGDCGGAQFFGDKFAGCLCWRVLAKTAKVVASDDETVTVGLSDDWDEETTATFLEAVGRK